VYSVYSHNISSIDGLKICVLASGMWGNANPKYFSLTIRRNRRNSRSARGGLKRRGERGGLVIQTKASRG
jgi:hypothetical protein